MVSRVEAALAAAAPIVARHGAESGVLGLIDVWALRAVSRAVWRAMRAGYNERDEFPFMARLLQHVAWQRAEIEHDLLEAMRVDGAIIAGSAVLAAITEARIGARWTPSDIDVFVRAAPDGSARTVFRRARPSAVETRYNSVRSDQPDEHYERADDNEEVYTGPDFCGAKYRFGSVDVDVVCPRSDEPRDYIATYFDMSLCQSSLRWCTQRARVVFHSPSAARLADRRILVNYTRGNQMRIVERCAKYRKRGYSLENGFIYRRLARALEVEHKLFGVCSYVHHFTSRLARREDYDFVRELQLNLAAMDALTTDTLRRALDAFDALHSDERAFADAAESTVDEPSSSSSSDERASKRSRR